MPSESFPSTIQAITFAKTGDFDVIEKTTVPFPKNNPSEIVVKIAYGGVNFIDTYFRQGLYPSASFPVTTGQEASGIIVALPTDPSVLNDKEYASRGYKVGSRVTIDGAGLFVEYVSREFKHINILPVSISLLHGAASLTQGITVVSFMTEAYNVQKGDIVLIHTVAGGLGLLFCQLAKHRGATVIGTTSTPEKAKFAKDHGADHVILYRSENTVKRVLEIVPEGVHAVFDGVGKDTFDANFELIRRKGTIVSVGNASGAVPPFSPLKLAAKNVKLCRPTMMGYAYGTIEERKHYANALFELITDGTFKINVHKEYPFTAEGVQQAQKDLVGGHTTGKVVIKVAELEGNSN